MGHELTKLDDVFLNEEGGAAWHGNGQLVKEHMGAVQAAEYIKLLWPVDQWGVTAGNEQSEGYMQLLAERLSYGDVAGAKAALMLFNQSRIPIDSHVANVRIDNIDGEDIRHVLGFVSRDYKICQNRQLAEFCDALAQVSGKVVVETVGSINGGQKVWFLIRGDSLNIGGVDKVTQYILASNSHDGTNAIRLTPTNIRTVCSNTLHAVIPRVEEGRTILGDSIIAVRHQGKIMDKLGEAKIAIRHYEATQQRMRETMERMNESPVDSDKVEEVFASFYASEFTVADADSLSTPASAKERRLADNRYERQKRAVSAFMSRYNREKRKLDLPDSKWLLFNGLSGWAQHDHRPTRGDAERIARNTESNLFGTNQQRTVRALELVLSA